MNGLRYGRGRVRVRRAFHNYSQRDQQQYAHRKSYPDQKFMVGVFVVLATGYFATLAAGFVGPLVS